MVWQFYMRPALYGLDSLALQAFSLFERWTIIKIEHNFDIEQSNCKCLYVFFVIVITLNFMATMTTQS